MNTYYGYTLVVVGAVPFHVLGDHVESMAGPDITDGVTALVGRAVDGVCGAGAPLVVGQGGV